MPVFVVGEEGEREAWRGRDLCVLEEVCELAIFYIEFTVIQILHIPTLSVLFELIGLGEGGIVLYVMTDYIISLVTRFSFQHRLGTLPIPNGILLMGTLIDLTLNWISSDTNASFIIRWKKEHLLAFSNYQPSPPVPVPSYDITYPSFWHRVFRIPRRTLSYTRISVYSGHTILNAGDRKDIEVVLFKAVDTFSWFTNIVDEVPEEMPEEWVSLEEAFGGCKVEFGGPIGIVHAIRSPKWSLKYRR